MHAGMLSFKTYLSTWLPFLLEIETSEPGDWSRERKKNIYKHWTKKDRGLIGYISNSINDNSGGFQLYANGLDHATRKKTDFSNPFTENCQVFKPEQFSTGFKQVFPILIQLGLMKSGELFCIENPESHLHPNLQLRFTEFLLTQAAIGKCIILETHSDLIVRRALRAILEESVYEDGTCKISQNDAVIWFSEIADLKKNDDDHESLCYRYKNENKQSIIYKLKINERGQISNWPEGFLDDALFENRRLIDILYKGDNNE
jgi:hypothetical protein